MKKIMRNIIFSSLLLTAVVAAPLICHESFAKAEAEVTETFPRAGSSGTVFYVDGGTTYFNSGEADVALYCFNSESDNAWSEKFNYRCFGTKIRVVIPGSSKTWAKFIVCRYDPTKNPASDGWDGVFNKTDDIYFSSFIQKQNEVIITGYGSDNKINYQLTYANNDYYGIRGYNHLYLDLSGFESWEENNAKYAFYFAAPNSGNATAWSSFCTKVHGQNNSHLYECVVPSLSENPSTGVSGTFWNLVIAVRFNPAASSPDFDNGYKWNQTQNISFNASNHMSNLVQISDWGHGELYNSDSTNTQNSITRAARLEFYGQYFLDTVVCSGNGNSDSTTSTMWNAVKDEYNQMSKLYQGDIWTCAADEEGTLIAQAMARYDYIVFYKGYSHEDFINRADSPNVTNYASVNNPLFENKQPLWIVITVIATAILSSSILVLVRINKKKKTFRHKGENL